MKNQERGNNLFCLFGDCENIALFGDYCADHQLQRAEAAEAALQAVMTRAAQLEAERDEARRQLEQARKWARVWKLAAKWHNLSAVISFGE